MKYHGNCIQYIGSHFIISIIDLYTNKSFVTLILIEKGNICSVDCARIIWTLLPVDHSIYWIHLSRYLDFLLSTYLTWWWIKIQSFSVFGIKYTGKRTLPTLYKIKTTSILIYYPMSTYISSPIQQFPRKIFRKQKK